ncbi:MAG: lipocalin family protein [Methylococcales bacterium]|nr:lipocalin family protein [Methylococcales bacterium]
MKRLIALFIVFLANCTGIPEGLQAVEDFDINRYTGTWYEIARLDNRFEKGLEKISATYQLRDDGGIDVINKGWNEQTGEWNQVEGKAYFIDKPTIGRLKVSFFGPFYGGYNIIDLDKKDYSYALVTGPDKSYLWILSKTKHLPEETLNILINRVKALGFATSDLIFVKQD